MLLTANYSPFLKPIPSSAWSGPLYNFAAPAAYLLHRLLLALLPSGGRFRVGGVRTLGGLEEVHAVDGGGRAHAALTWGPIQLKSFQLELYGFKYLLRPQFDSLICLNFKLHILRFA